MADGSGLARMLVGFSRELRAAGVPTGSGDTLTFTAAMAPLDPTDLVDLYWAGRATLVSRRDHIPIYHRVFVRYFLDGPPDPEVPQPFSVTARAEARATLEVPETEPGDADHQEQEAELGLVASDAATVRTKSFAACGPDELAAVHRIMRRIRVVPPRRRSRRRRPSTTGGAPDLRRTVRASLRTHGEPAALRWRRRQLRLRPLILVLDVSGSMADHSRALLQFAYGTARAAPRVEVFCFGTRLTRITRELEHHRPDEALARAATAVVDWDGGTRIGASLATLVRDWGRRGTLRGGIVAVCSDGLDRGDPAVLAGAMERLSRLCHRIVWLNPHVGDRTDVVPSTLGMMVAAPHVDRVLSGHDLASLEEFAALLPSLR